MHKKKKKILILIIFLFTILLNFVNTNQNLPVNLYEGEEPYKIKSSATVSSLWNYTTGSGVSCSPALADIDGDGKLEVIIGSTDSHVYAINGEDGSSLWISDSAGAGFHSSPALGDIDNDGKLEVVIGNFDNHLYALNAEDGSQLWNYSTGDDVVGSPALADIDGDNMLEAVFGSYDDKIYAINGENGSLLWSYTTTSDINTSPAIGDIDNDGKLEVVIGNGGNTTYALNGEDGSVVWTFISNHTLASSVSLGDLDFDGELEAVIYFIYGLKTMIYALNGLDGSVLWTHYRRMHADTVPAIGDIDNDGNLEVVFGSSLVLNGEDGSTYLDRQNDPISRPASLGDVDGDGKMELITASMGYSVFAINIDTNTTAWEFPLPYYVISTPVLGDLDGDGELEVVFGCQDHNVYAVDITNAGNHIEWQGNSGDLIFQRRKNYNFVPNQTDQNPVCVIEPKIDNQVITEVCVGEYFNIYVGDSYDDHEISEVRFTSDSQQDGISTGTWSSWYDWDTSSGDWDASNKKMEWLFGSGGYKEIWAEVKDNNSQITRSRAHVTAIYNITQDSRLLVIPKSDKTQAFGDVDLTIRLYQILPNGDLEAYRDALEDWGLNFYEFTKIHACWLLEIGEVDKLLDLIQSTVPDILTPLRRQWFNEYLSDDGSFRIVLTSMSDFSEFKSSTFTELFEILVKIFLHQPMLKINYDTFQKFKDTFKIFFKTCVGSNQYITRLKLRPDFLKVGAISLFKSFIMELSNYYNFELTRLKISNNVLSSSVITSFKILTENFDAIYDSIKLATKIANVIVSGGTNPLAFIKLGTKAITFYLDYMMHYEAGEYGWFVDKLYAACSFIDPPVAKLDLQIRNATTGEILLGYDPITNTTRYFCDFGFFTGDLESQFAFIDPSIGPLNISIINTHLDPHQPYIYLNQSVFFGLTNRSEFTHIFSYIQSNQSISTILNYSVSEGLIFNQVKVELLDVGNTWSIIRIMDQYNSSIQDPTISTFLSDEKITYIAQSLGEGIYNVSFGLEFTDMEIMISVDKRGYLSNSIIVSLGDWIPIEETVAAIPLTLLPILILAFLSISVLIIKTKKEL